MKKKTETYNFSQELASVKLYLDDLDEIVGKMKKVCSKVDISNEDYEFDSLKDLKENSGDKIKQISIMGHSPFIRLEIGRYKILLSAFGESEVVAGLWHFLRDFLRSKAGWYSRFLNPWAWGYVTFGYIFVCSPFADKISTYPIIDKVLIAVLFIMIFLFVLSLLIRWKGSTIYLERKHKVSNFWERNKDNIIMIVIGAVIGWFCKILYGFIFK